MYRRIRGFTLIELLVVLAVIALLFSVLIPALRISKQKGTSLVCTANLRQLAMACQIYTQDYNRYPPGFVSTSAYGAEPPGEPIGDQSADWYGWWWFYFIADSIGDDFTQDSVLGCPGRKQYSNRSINHILCGNYGINYSISKIRYSNTESEFLGTPLKSDQIRTPSRIYYLMDSGYALVSWKVAVESSASPSFEIPKRVDSYYLPGLSVNNNRDIQPDQQQDAIRGRHSKAINVGFADGHTEPIKTVKWPLHSKEQVDQGNIMLSSWRGH